MAQQWTVTLTCGDEKTWDYKPNIGDTVYCSKCSGYSTVADAIKK